MKTPKYFQPNSPNVIHEVVDGEAILVNLESGSYYSIDKVGAVIWSLIESNTAIPQMVDMIEKHYAGTRSDIEHGIEQLLDQLQTENLIQPGYESEREDATQTPEVNVDTAKRPVFEAPVLQKYTDMEDLLLLDPIHDVDETGWPNVEPENE